MISRLLVILLFLAGLAPVNSFAQDNSIKVIKEDGAIQSLELPKTKKVSKKPDASISTEDLLKQMEEAIGDETEDKTQAFKGMKVQPQKEDTEDFNAETLKQPEQASPQMEAKQKSETPPVKTTKKVKKAPSRKAVSQNKNTVKQVRRYQPSDVVPIPPNQKPEKVEIIEQAEPVIIDKDEAVRIALDYAPPSRSFTVFENRSYKDKTVFQVTFKTDQGFHDVLVDSKTGAVLKK